MDEDKPLERACVLEIPIDKLAAMLHLPDDAGIRSVSMPDDRFGIVRISVGGIGKLTKIDGFVESVRPYILWKHEQDGSKKIEAINWFGYGIRLIDTAIDK